MMNYLNQSIMTLVDNIVISLNSKTILLQSSAKDILRKLNKPSNRKGIDFRLYQNGNQDKDDIQTVMTFLSSMQNPDPSSCREKSDVELLISQELDRIILSDRVRSCTDFYKVHNKRNIEEQMQVEQQQPIERGVNSKPVS
jgi:hypothetical protein